MCLSVIYLFSVVKGLATELGKGPRGGVYVHRGKGKNSPRVGHV